MGIAIQVTPQELDDAEIAQEVPCSVDPTWQRLEELRAGASIRYIGNNKPEVQKKLSKGYI